MNNDVNKSINYLLNDPPVSLNFALVRENRYALDGKWDYEIGFWVETAVIHQQFDFMDYRYRNQLNVGLDYTFPLGNGVHALFEYYYLAFSKQVEFRNGYEIAAAMLDYPLNIFDRIMGLVYYDLENSDFYNFFSWQRSYDNWSLNTIVFLNPNNNSLSFKQNRDTASYALGKGFQFMLVYHY